jgi:hypothetical protein
MSSTIQIFYHYIKDDILDTDAFKTIEDLRDYSIVNKKENYNAKLDFENEHIDNSLYALFRRKELDDLMNVLVRTGILTDYFFEGVYTQTEEYY